MQLEETRLYDERAALMAQRASRANMANLSALLGLELAIDGLFRLGRQFRGHLFFGPAQQKRAERFGEHPQRFIVRRR